MNDFNRSIHPRVVNGRTVHPKVNTSKKPDPAVAARKAAARAAHDERQREMQRTKKVR